MANGTPTFTNPNWHEFQPSAIETNLASSVDNPATPSAFPLLMGYMGQRQANDGAYADQLAQMHQNQMMEFNANQQQTNLTRLGGMLEHINDPGAAQTAVSLGLIPEQSANPWITSLTASSDAKNLNEAGSGLGRAAQGGFTNLPTAPLGPNVKQGPNPQITSAEINAAGRRDAASAAGGPRITLPYGPPGPSQGSVSYKAAPGTPLQPAPGQPGSGTAPPPQLSEQAQRIIAQIKDPEAARDVSAAAIANGGNLVAETKNGVHGVKGASGKTYY